MKIARRFVAFVRLFRSVILLASCALAIGGNRSIATASDEEVKVDGSTGVMPLAKALAARYTERHPKRITRFGDGMKTGERIDALLDGRIDVAVASHGLDWERFESAGLKVYPFARMVVLFAVHDSVPVRDLSERQILDIYSGKISNWNQLGGPDLNIVPLRRPKDEVDFEVVAERIEGFATLNFSSQTRVGNKSGDLAQMLDSTPGSIGMTTRARTVIGKHMVPLKLNGVSPEVENVVSGKYMLSRDAFLIVRKDAGPKVVDWKDFFLSIDVVETLKNNGAAPATANR